MWDELASEVFDPRRAYVPDLPSLPRVIAGDCAFCTDPRRHEIDDHLRSGNELPEILSEVANRNHRAGLDALRVHRDRHVERPPERPESTASSQGVAAALLATAEGLLSDRVEEMSAGQPITATGMAAVARLITIVEHLHGRAAEEAHEADSWVRAQLTIGTILTIVESEVDPDTWAQIGRRVNNERDLDAMHRFMRKDETDDSARRYDELVAPLFRRAVPGGSDDA